MCKIYLLDKSLILVWVLRKLVGIYIFYNIYYLLDIIWFVIVLWELRIVLRMLNICKSYSCDCGYDRIIV